jgi:hypothetical protein
VEVPALARYLVSRRGMLQAASGAGPSGRIGRGGLPRVFKRGRHCGRPADPAAWAAIAVWPTCTAKSSACSAWTPTGNEAGAIGLNSRRCTRPRG